MRDLPGLQDGRPAHVLHLAHAHKHEQAEEHEGQVGVKCRVKETKVSQDEF